ncbi:MAG: phosphoribosylglycinamide formyltransferase [Candidatus Dadabacteria bacterium]|nr:MAG: phosphoribosylglycinamide formyltransferase [Candidatus Dadabacteria bacterium]
MTVRPRLGICVSGRGSNMQALLRAAQRGELLADPVVVFSNHLDAPALERARAAGVAVEALESRGYASRADYDAAVVQCLQPYDCDIIALAGYMRIVTPTFLNAWPGRVLNIHPSLLPAFPGLHAVEQAWSYGVRVSGCTVHFVDAEVDHGPIIVQRAVSVLPDDTVDRLAARILEQEHDAFVEAVNLVAAGRVRLEGRRVLIEPE